ncbi:MAG: prepilin-type N-terminal cleavage/methylation domain-containing protein [Candidatus Omnitrophica bacterium]|nr:prepilin-type N-terminal cleavage/methylation domain-containing protein [Candidatus Omnitrophota bacterium]
MHKAFTLIELMIVIIIVGILASIAIPNFSKMVEKAKAEQAATYLRVIRTGEKIYWSNNSTYIACADTAEIKTNIGAEVTPENYTFSVASGTGSGQNITNSFTATATRRSDSSTITLDQDGVWGGDSPYKPTN